MARRPPLNNLTALAAPTSLDDHRAGYSVGSLWIHVGETAYICVATAVGGVVWVDTDAAASAVASSIVNDSDVPGTNVDDALNASYATGLATGLLSGGELSINVDTELYDISAGSGQVVDTTIPSNHVLIPVAWAANTGISPPDILTTPTTFVGMDSSGTRVEQAFPFTPAQRRTLISLGRIEHIDNVNIFSPIPLTIPAVMPVHAVWDIMQALGILNISGNVFSANGTNLALDKTVGSQLSGGANFHNDPLNPNEPIQAAVTAAGFGTVLSSHRDGSGGWITAPLASGLVSPSLYDDGSGTLAAVASNRWTVQQLLLSPEGFIILPYGQTLYISQSNALEGVADIVEDNPDFESINRRGWLVVRGGTTDLSDTGDNLFVPANKFGERL